jgi:hypothetical protein
MRKSFLFAQRRFVFVLFLFSSLMGGCDGFLSGLATPIPCTAELTAANIYRKELKSWANMIFASASPATPPALPTDISQPSNTPALTDTALPVTTPMPVIFNELRIQDARYAAFDYLVSETTRWTAVQPIGMPDGSQAEIVITFISPGMIEAVVLSDILRDNFVNLDFQAQARAALDKVAQRNELLFLVMVTSAGTTTNPVSHGINILIDDLALNNAENLLFKPTHNDYNLEQPINPFAKPVFGYVAYPLVQQQADGKCKQALDSTFDTNIFITLGSIQVDGTSMGPYSWTIPYAALINSSTPADPPMIMMPSGFNTDIMSPSSNPPSGIGQNNINKWYDLARFIWWKVMLGN